MIITYPECNIIAGGVKLHMFNSVRQQVADAPADCLYNSQMATFVSAAGRNVRVWSARTGKLQEEFRGITDSDITSMCFDSRERKLVLGTQVHT